MSLTLLDTEHADRDLTSEVAVLTHTPSASDAKQCQAMVLFGDGSKDLDGSGGAFAITVTVGSQTVEPDPQTVTFSSAARTAIWTNPFPVPANSAVVVKAKSPNAADTDVDVTAYLYEVPHGEIVDIYHAVIDLTIDDANSQDEYTVVWFKNGVRLAAGITLPKIQGVKRADGTDLVAETAMTAIGSSGGVKYDATTTKRTTEGEAVVVIVKATIDGAVRTFSEVVGRDSSA